MKFLNIIQKVIKVAKVVVLVVISMFFLGAAYELFVVGKEVFTHGSKAVDMELIAHALEHLVHFAANGILLLFVSKYLTHEIHEGTPYTEEGAKELKELGIHALLHPVITASVITIIYVLCGKEFPSFFTESNYIGILLGVVILFVAMVVKYGAEDEKTKNGKIYTSIEQLVGNTPLVELTKIEKEYNLSAKIYAKPEYFNPAGSAKDRVALKMIQDAEERGVINENSVIIEPTSGNTGIGLAAVAGAKGYRVIIVMPDSMSEERCTLMKAYGAELVLTPGAEGMKGAIRKAEELAKKIPNAFIPGQFENPANAKAHFETTGPEIYKDTAGEVDIFVAGVGTGGTITGVGEYLKSQKPEVKIIAVEPESSAFLSKGVAGAHKIQGIGAGFIPKVLNTGIYDEIIPVSNEASFEAARLIGKKEGFLVGISSGAALWAAIEVAKRPENANKKIVVLLPDTGDRYLSTELYKV